MKNLLLAAAAVVGLSACTGPGGEIDYARTALLGAGVGAGAFMLGGVMKGDQQPRGYGYGGGHHRHKPAGYYSHPQPQPYYQQPYQHAYPQAYPQHQPYYPQQQRGWGF